MRSARPYPDAVARQVDCGLDVVTDGEMSKPSFITYVTDRLTGFDPSREPGSLPWAGSKEVAAFPEFYDPSLRAPPRRASPARARSVTAATRAGLRLLRGLDGDSPDDRRRNLRRCDRRLRRRYGTR